MTGKAHAQTSEIAMVSGHKQHLTYCDRAMAADIATLAARLGHDRFAVAGHERGSYVAYRTALDHPQRVTSLAVLDSVPILEALQRAGPAFAESWWHWFFYSAPPMPNGSSIRILLPGIGLTPTPWGQRTTRTWWTP